MNERELYNKIKKQLAEGLPSSSEFEAKLIFEKIFAKKPRELSAFDHVELPDDVVDTAMKLVARRVEGYPLQYILGEWELMGLTFLVGEGVLIPRQDTETLVETAIDFLKGRKNPTVADLCSGSGCIAISIAHFCGDSTVWAVEASSAAYKYLNENIIVNSTKNVTAVHSDIFTVQTIEMLPQFDLIVCNPPYLTRDELFSLQREVRHEPIVALDGGNDGLRYYRDISRYYFDKLLPGGRLMFEVGAQQADSVSEIMEKIGYENISTHLDLCGIKRVVAADRPKGETDSIKL